MCGAADDDDAAVGEDQAGGQVEVIGEDGDLVGLAVAVGVLEDLDAVVALAAAQHAVRVVDRLDHPQPAALVEREGDRLAAIIGSCGEELDLELGRRLDELLRVGGASSAAGTSGPDRASRSWGR